MKEKFRIGEYVKWDYRHHLNSQSSITRTKLGIYLGRVKHRDGYRCGQLCRVKFEKNKSVSRVFERELY